MNRRDAWRDAVWASDLPTLPRFVALAFAAHSGPDGLDVWVSVRRLAERTGMSSATAGRCVARLRADGWLTLTARGSGHRAARFALTVPGLASHSCETLTDGLASHPDGLASHPGGLASQSCETETFKKPNKTTRARPREAVPPPAWFLEQRGGVGRMPE